jgi:hypothetical protein
VRVNVKQIQARSGDSPQIYKSAVFVMQSREKQGKAVAEREKMSLIATCPAMETPVRRHRWWGSCQGHPAAARQGEGATGVRLAVRSPPEGTLSLLAFGIPDHHLFANVHSPSHYRQPRRGSCHRPAALSSMEQPFSSSKVTGSHPRLPSPIHRDSCQLTPAQSSTSIPTMSTSSLRPA